jgi:hypothetical protein
MRVWPWPGGKLHPLEAYEQVWPVFLVYAAAHGTSTADTDHALLARYDEVQTALGLRLDREDGAPVATSWIAIMEWSEVVANEPPEVEAQIPDPAFWSDEGPSEPV